MTKLKSRMAGAMAGLLCIMSILQPLTLYASGEEVEPAPAACRVSALYHGKGNVVITDHLGVTHEISVPEEETTFECGAGVSLMMKAEAEEGCEIDAVEISGPEAAIDRAEVSELSDSRNVFEREIQVLSDIRIEVYFTDITENTESESVAETESAAEAISTAETVLSDTVAAETVSESETKLKDGVETNETVSDTLESETAIMQPETAAVETMQPETDVLGTEGKPELETEYQPGEEQDGLLSESERSEAETLSKEMDTAIKANENVMTLNVGEVGQNWGMYSLFVKPVIIGEFEPDYLSDPYSHIIQTGPTYTEYTRTAYCVQYGTPIPAGSYTTETVLPQLQQNYIGYALAYGWKQTGTAYDESQYSSVEARTEYAVTQAIIWACSRGKFNTDSGEAAIHHIIQNTHAPAHGEAYYEQLKASILNAETIPSFSGNDENNPPTILLKWNPSAKRYEAVVSDSNNVLDRYNYACDGIHFEKNGSQLTIWSNNLYIDGVKVGAEYVNNGGANAVVTWNGENGTQDLATYAEISNHVYSYIRIVTEGLGSLELIKKSSNPEVSDNNGAYSLEGAVYGLYDDSDREVGRIQTDVNGWGQLADIPAGTYTVKEITAPKGFYVDTTAHNVTIVPGQAATLTVEDVPKMETIDIVLAKIDAETESDQPSGSAPLEGALFNVKFYNVQQDSDPASSGCEPVRQWLLKTDAHGYCAFKDSYKVSGDDFYYDSNGKEALPCGTLTIREAEAPTGYLLNDELFVRKIAAEDSEGVSGYNYPVVSDVPQKIQIELEKVDSETGEGTPQGAASFEGAVYEVLDSENKPADTLTVDGTGHAVSKELPTGIYRVKETVSSNGYLVDPAVYTVDASNPEDKTSKVLKYKVTSGEDIIRGDVEIVKFYEKLDDDTDTLEGIENVEFTLTSKTTGEVVRKIVTDKRGFATTASAEQPRGSLLFDTYVVTETAYPEEVKPIEPFEVTISEEGVTLKGIYKEDKLIVSPVTVVKKDKETGNIIPLAGAEFRLLDGEKQPVTMTVHYPETQVCKTFKTNEKGQFTFPEKLKYGTYYLEEIQAPKGYLKGELLEFKVTEGASWENPLVIEFFDEPAMGQLRIMKKDAESGELLSDAEFDIIAAEDIIASDGTLRLKKGEIAGHLITKEGIAESEKLYFGNYELQETRQPQGYILSEETYPIKLEYKDQMTEVALLETEIKNYPVKIKIHTKAEDKNDGDKIISADENAAIVDRVSCENLMPGSSYQLIGILMNKATGEPLLINNQTVISERVFRAEKADEEIIMEFAFDASGFEDMELVVFEKLLDADGNETAAHEDINDEGQTVRLKKKVPLDTPKTGDGSPLLKVAGLGFAAILVMARVWRKKRRKSR